MGAESVGAAISRPQISAHGNDGKSQAMRRFSGGRLIAAPTADGGILLLNGSQTETKKQRQALSSRPKVSQRRTEAERSEKNARRCAALRSLDSAPLSFRCARDDAAACSLCCFYLRSVSTGASRMKPSLSMKNQKGNKKNAQGGKALRVQTVDKPLGCIEGAAASSIVIRRRRRVRRRGAAESRFLYQFLAVK